MEISSSFAAAQTMQNKPKSAISSDFETFLRMLTVQMQNQDPLNPIESGDYAVQLATFSGVEQQVRSNELLQQLVTSGDVSGMATLADWIGREARAAVEAEWAGTPITVYAGVIDGAERSELVVMDGQGSEVQRIAFDPGRAEIDWAGVGAGGVPLPYGQYSFYVASYQGDTPLEVTQAEVYREVTEVRLEDGASRVYFSNGESVASNDISALRR